MEISPDLDGSESESAVCERERSLTRTVFVKSIMERCRRIHSCENRNPTFVDVENMLDVLITTLN